MTSLSSFLNSLDNEIFQRSDDKISETDAAQIIQKLEPEFPGGIPADYKEFLTTFQGGFLMGPDGMINFESLEFVGAFNQNPTTIENFNKTVFIFGDDQVGGIYFFDIGNQFGKGANAIFNTAFAPPHLRESPTFCASTLTEFVQRLTAN